MINLDKVRVGEKDVSTGVSEVFILLELQLNYGYRILYSVEHKKLLTIVQL